jgi:hypothetical protein
MLKSQTNYIITETLRVKITMNVRKRQQQVQSTVYNFKLLHKRHQLLFLCVPKMIENIHPPPHPPSLPSYLII